MDVTIRTLNFLTYMTLKEDMDAEITKIQSDIANIDNQISQRTSALTNQKVALQRVLDQKQKIKQAQSDQPDPNQQRNQQQNQQQQQQAAGPKRFSTTSL